MKPDFGATARDYRAHRAGFPASFFDRLGRLGVGLKGQLVVDLGTGTGTLARNFARRGCRVVGIDPALALLEQARELDVTTGVEVDYALGRAEQMGLRSKTVDVVSAGQCWHWFDREKAAREVARILHPDGVLLIAHFDWIPLPGNLVEATEQLIESHNPAWKLGGGLGIHPWWLRDLGRAAFREIETFSYDVMVPYGPEDWRGRIRASAGVGASLSEEKVRVFDRALERFLAEHFPEDPLSVPHRVFAITALAPAQA